MNKKEQGNLELLQCQNALLKAENDALKRKYEKIKEQYDTITNRFLRLIEDVYGIKRSK